MPPFRVVEKNDPARAIALPAPFATAAHQLLLSRYLGGEPLGAAAQAQLAELFALVEQREGWLADGAGAPVLYTVVNRQGRYHLRQFARELEPGRAQPADSLHEPLADPVLNFHRAFAVLGAGGDAAARGNGPEGEATNRLGGFLYQLLEQAGIARLPARFPTAADRREAIASAVEAYALVEGVPARDFFHFSYSDAQAKRLERQLAATALRWPQPSRPYALCLVVARKFEGQSAELGGRSRTCRIDFAGAAHRPGRIGTSGPFLALFTFAENAAQRGRFAPVRAFGVPIFSEDCWIPVESNHERRVLALLQPIVEAGIRRGWPLRLSKPLKNVVHSGEAKKVRPDFILSWENEALALEVLGLDDPGYLQRKAEAAAVIRRHMAYEVFNAHAAATEREWRREEARVSTRISAWLGARS